MRALRQRPATFALALVLGINTAVQGQGPAGAPTPDSLRVAAARRLLESIGAVELMVAGFRANLPAQRAASPQLPAEFWTRFESRMVSDAPQLLDSIAALYARTFNQTELAALSEFYRSPAGQKLRHVQPTLLAESTAMGQRWGARLGAEIAASLSPK